MNQYETVIYEVDDRVATIRLNRPGVLNAFNRQLRSDLRHAVIAAASDDDVGAVILTGTGRAFCSGADLAEDGGPDFLPQLQLEDEFKPGIMTIASAKKPFIAAINGTAAGAGCGYALACDLILMADDAYLYQAFISVGLIPDAGTTWQLVHTLGPKRAYEAMISGTRMPAARCVELGLANAVVPAADLMSAALLLAQDLVHKAPLALQYSKLAVRKVAQMNLADAVSYEAALQNRLVRSEDGREGVEAFMQKRKPIFKGR